MNINISELCEEISGVLSLHDKVSVTYFNGKKPTSYHVPNVLGYRDYERNEKTEFSVTWFAEIYVNDLCVFRESYTPADGDWAKAEEIANKKLIRSIFTHGITFAEKILKDFRNKQSPS